VKFVSLTANPAIIVLLILNREENFEAASPLWTHTVLFLFSSRLNIFAQKLVSLINIYNLCQHLCQKILAEQKNERLEASRNENIVAAVGI
jgi:hypothetical protein